MAAEAGGAALERLKVFVSYSRTDLDFADQLVLALEDKGFDALVDRHDIDAAEKWKDRLGALIGSCDTVVFVLSEKSAGSPICQWEVEEAARLGKRIIPVLPQDSTGVAPPPALSELNYIHFFKHPSVPGSGFYDGVQKLDRALKVNLGWLRRQTAYEEQAGLWAADRSDDRLLSGKPLEEALQWRANAPAGAAASPLVLEYIAAGETVSARRRAEADANIAEREAALKRARGATIVGGVVAVVLTIFAGTAAFMAARANVAAAAGGSDLFSREARTLSAEGREAEAMLMALHGDPDAQGALASRLLRPAGGFTSAQAALMEAATTSRLIQRFRGHDERPVEDGKTQEDRAVSSSLTLPPLPGEKGRRFLTGSGIEIYGGSYSRATGRIALWRSGDFAPLAETFSSREPGKKMWGVVGMALVEGGAPGKEHFLSAHDHGEIDLREVGKDAPIQSWSLNAQAQNRYNAIGSFALLPDIGGERRILTGWSDGVVRLWRLGNDQPDVTFKLPDASDSGDDILSIAVLNADAPGAERFVTASYGGRITLWQVDKPGAGIRFQTERQGAGWNAPLVVAIPGGSPGQEWFLSTGTDTPDGKVELWQADQPDSSKGYYAVADYTKSVRRILVLPPNERAGLRPEELAYGEQRRYDALEFVVAYADNSVRLWRNGRVASEWNVPLNRESVLHLALQQAAQNGNHSILIGGSTGSIGLWRPFAAAPESWIGRMKSIQIFAMAPPRADGRQRALMVRGGYVTVKAGKWSEYGPSAQFWTEGESKPDWQQDFFETSADGQAPGSERVRFENLQLVPGGDPEHPKFLGTGNAFDWGVWVIDGRPGAKPVAFKPYGLRQGFTDGPPLAALTPDASGATRFATGITEHQGNMRTHQDAIAIWTDSGASKPIVLYPPEKEEWPGGLQELQRLPPDPKTGAEEFLASYSKGWLFHWRVGADKPLSRFKLADGYVTFRVLDRDGDGTPRILLKAYDRPIALMRLGGKEPIKTFAYEDGVEDIAILPKRAPRAPTFFLVSPARTQWDINERVHPPALIFRTDNDQPIGRVATAGTPLSDGERIAVSGEDRPVDIFRLDTILFASPRNEVQIACKRLLAARATQFTPESTRRFKILNRPVNANPCKGVWPLASKTR